LYRQEMPVDQAVFVGCSLFIALNQETHLHRQPVDHVLGNVAGRVPGAVFVRTFLEG
jgi:hypothetical protein